MSVTASTTLISVEEYLRTEYDPSCDYIDGVLRQKSMPTFKHGRMEHKLCNLVDRFVGYCASPEQTVRIREAKYLVPDVAVQRVSGLRDPFPVEPIHLCIEIMSPGDRFGEIVSKCDEYHAWGVEHCWIVDPEDQRCWQYDSGGRPNEVPQDGQITAGPIILSHADIFASL